MLIIVDARPCDMDYFMEMACFFAKMLGIAHIPDITLEITIYEDTQLDDYAVGYCYEEQDGVIQIDVALCGLTQDPCGVVLAHEMIHARQELHDWSHFCEDETDELEFPLYAAYLDWRDHNVLQERE